MKITKNPAPCPYNGGVVCRVQLFCEKCGWNPAAAEERLRKIKEENKEWRETK